MKIDFSVEIVETNDTTLYHIDVDGKRFASFTDMHVQFYNEADVVTINERMAILQRAWDEFVKRDSWSDFTFTI